MFGGAVDENVFGGEPFGEGRAQFKFTDHLNGPALRAPPAQQRRHGLGFAGQPMAEGDF
jgi:hypothetical protein